MWSDFENDTLIHHHKMSKVYKKRYQRAGDLQNSLYSFWGLITVITSTMASTISWGVELDSSKKFILSTVTTTAAVTAAIQNFYKFKETSNNYINTAKSYAKIQNRIEGVGNIHPQCRDISPSDFFKQIQESFDQISDKRTELSNLLTKCCYHKKNDDDSYLQNKHLKYNKLNKDDDNKGENC